MGDPSVFDWACDALEGASPLDRLEARGTLRLALRSSGLEATQVTAGQMRIVIERRLPEQLRKCGVDAADDVCSRIAKDLEARALAGGTGTTTGESPESVFERLGDL